MTGFIIARDEANTEIGIPFCNIISIRTVSGGMFVVDVIGRKNEVTFFEKNCNSIGEFLEKYSKDTRNRDLQ